MPANIPFHRLITAAPEGGSKQRQTMQVMNFTNLAPNLATARRAC